MKKKRPNQPKLIANRRARHDYTLGDSVIAGIVLNGAETKALRLGHGHLRGAYATIKDDELWLINATIVGTSGVQLSESEQTRTRKLLVNKRQIATLLEAKRQGGTIVPLEILTAGRFIKVRLAIGKGKKQYDKREAIKKREESRRLQSAVKRQVR